MHLMPSLVWSDTTSEYAFTLTNETGVPIDTSTLTSLSLTYYAFDMTTWAPGSIINNRDEQDALTLAEVSLLGSSVTWLLQPEDLVSMYPAASWEIHEAVWRWSWDAGVRHGAHVVDFGIRQLAA